jgi:micrococcal nuclease
VRNLRWLIPLAIVALLAVRYLPGVLGGDEADEAGIARVVRVVDGDTIQIERGGRTDRVRYIGIDTPESVKPGTPVQCFAHEASRENEGLVAGRTVQLVPGAEARDRYGRLLAYVYRASDGVFVNELLVRKGYARTMTIAPNDRFAGRFAALQERARANGTGLWGACPAGR